MEPVECTEPEDLPQQSERGAGYKYDSGKLQAGILFEDFPLALREVLLVCTMGANKYKRSSWRDVEDKERRYYDALFRHQLAKACGTTYDEESGLRHEAHAIWNQLALLQMALEKEEEKQSG